MSHRIHFWLVPLVVVGISGALYARLRAPDVSPAVAHARAAGRLEAEGQPVLAAREWLIAAALDPRMAAAREGLGRAFQAEGAAALAIRELQAAATLEPRRPHAYCRLAEALQEGGVQSDALLAARYAVRTDPRCARAHRTLGTLLAGQEDRSGAVRELEAAALLDPRDRISRMWLARILMEQDRLPDAEARAREAHALDKDDVEAAYLLARIRLRQGEPAATAEAEQLLKSVVAAAPDYSPARVELAKLYHARGRLLAARWELERALEIEPRNREVLAQLAELHTALKKPERSAALRQQAAQIAAEERERSELERQVAAQPDDPLLLFRLGLALAREGAVPRAITLLERAREMLPGDPVIGRRLQELRTLARPHGGAPVQTTG